MLAVRSLFIDGINLLSNSYTYRIVFLAGLKENTAKLMRMQLGS